MKLLAEGVAAAEREINSKMPRNKVKDIFYVAANADLASYFLFQL